MTNLLLRLNCNFQPGAKCNRPTFFFIDFFGFNPALTNLIEVLQLVFETVYDDKKDWNTEIRPCRTDFRHKSILIKLHHFVHWPCNLKLDCPCQSLFLFSFFLNRRGEFLVSMRVFSWDLKNRYCTKTCLMRLVVIHDFFKIKSCQPIGYNICCNPFFSI